MWYQKEIIIKNKDRGFHLITDEIIQNFTELSNISIGLLHLFIKHTSASLTVNENYSQNVRNDFETHFNKMVPEGPHITLILKKGRMICPRILNHQYLGTH